MLPYDGPFVLWILMYQINITLKKHSRKKLLNIDAENVSHKMSE